MATVYREFRIQAPLEQVWAALRDFGALHEVLARGFVVGRESAGDTRTITFSNTKGPEPDPPGTPRPLPDTYQL